MPFKGYKQTREHIELCKQGRGAPWNKGLSCPRQKLTASHAARQCDNLFVSSLQPKKHRSGIYAIINTTNRKIYIGSAVELVDRLAVHRYDFRKGNHRNIYFQRAVTKNPEAFEFTVIEEVDDKAKLIPREQFWINFFKSYLPENGYNISRTAGSCLGHKQTHEHIEKVASKNRGRKHPPRSEEWRKKLSVALTGRKLSPESIARRTLTQRANGSRLKPVIQCDLNGNRLAVFNSITEAALKLGSVSKTSGIVEALKGRYTQSYGFKWIYG